MVVYGEGAYRGRDGIRAARRPRRSPTSTPAASTRVDDDGDAARPRCSSTRTSPLDPRNVYAATKLAQEHLAAAWARATGGAVAALRYHNVYGPGMPQNTPYAGVASLFRSALERGEAPRVFEDGAQRRDFVHVADVASANLAALGCDRRRRRHRFRAFNVGSGDVHTIGELATALSRHAGGPAPVVTGEYRLGDVRHITASSARLRDELGWHAVGRVRRRHARVRDRAAAGGGAVTRRRRRRRVPLPRTRRRRCPGCCRGCPTATARSSSTTGRPMARPRSPARTARRGRRAASRLRRGRPRRLLAATRPGRRLLRRGRLDGSGRPAARRRPRRSTATLDLVLGRRRPTTRGALAAARAARQPRPRAA